MLVQTKIEGVHYLIKINGQKKLLISQRERRLNDFIQEFIDSGVKDLRGFVQLRGLTQTYLVTNINKIKMLKK